MVSFAIVLFALQLLLPVRGAIECGVPKVFPRKATDRQMYIFKGDDVPIGMFPWIGYVVYGSPKKYAECTVSLVKPRWLVTAAHCILDECAKEAYVVLGIVSREALRPKHIYKVEKMFHPKITGFRSNINIPVHDIAVIKLEKEVDIRGSNGTINTICLPKPDQELTGTMYLSGWGLTAEDAITSADSLKYIKADVLKNFRCEEDESKFCLKGVKKDQTPYRGDSGGPAQMLVDGKYYLHGALSGGNTSISLYTTVKNYMGWLSGFWNDEDTVEVNSCKA